MPAAGPSALPTQMAVLNMRPYAHPPAAHANTHRMLLSLIEKLGSALFRPEGECAPAAQASLGRGTPGLARGAAPAGVRSIPARRGLRVAPEPKAVPYLQALRLRILRKHLLLFPCVPRAGRQDHKHSSVVGTTSEKECSCLVSSSPPRQSAG